MNTRSELMRGSVLGGMQPQGQMIGISNNNPQYMQTAQGPQPMNHMGMLHSGGNPNMQQGNPPGMNMLNGAQSTQMTPNQRQQQMQFQQQQQRMIVRTQHAQGLNSQVPGSFPNNMVNGPPLRRVASQPGNFMPQVGGQGGGGGGGGPMIGMNHQSAQFRQQAQATQEHQQTQQQIQQNHLRMAQHNLQHPDIIMGMSARAAGIPRSASAQVQHSNHFQQQPSSSSPRPPSHPAMPIPGPSQSQVSRSRTTPDNAAMFMGGFSNTHAPPPQQAQFPPPGPPSSQNPASRMNHTSPFPFVPSSGSPPHDIVPQQQQQQQTQAQSRMMINGNTNNGGGGGGGNGQQQQQQQSFHHGQPAIPQFESMHPDGGGSSSRFEDPHFHGLMPPPPSNPPRPLSHSSSHGLMQVQPQQQQHQHASPHHDNGPQQPSQSQHHHPLSMNTPIPIPHQRPPSQPPRPPSSSHSQTGSTPRMQPPVIPLQNGHIPNNPNPSGNRMPPAMQMQLHQQHHGMGGGSPQASGSGSGQPQQMIMTPRMPQSQPMPMQQHHAHQQSHPQQHHGQQPGPQHQPVNVNHVASASSSSAGSSHSMQAGPSTGAESCAVVDTPDVSRLIGSGQGLQHLLKFSAMLAHDSPQQKLSLKFWNDLIMEYFTPKAIMKFTLWKDNQKSEAKPFEIGTPILPRFFLVTAQSGVKSMSLTLDGARERLYDPGHCVVECFSAAWIFHYANGYTVTLRGPLTCHVILCHPHPPGTQPPQAQGSSQTPPPPPGTAPKFILKFDDFQFDANNHDKTITVECIQGTRLPRSPKPSLPMLRNGSATASNSSSTTAGTDSTAGTAATTEEEDRSWEEPRISIENAMMPGEPVNAFGIPQATMRCLELAESVGQMGTLIAFSNESRTGPMDALAKFAAHIRETQPAVAAGALNPFLQFPNGPTGPVNGVPSTTLYPPAPAPPTAGGPPTPANHHNSPQTLPPSTVNSPQKQHKTIPPPPAVPAGANTPTAPASASSTPALANASLKRKQNASSDNTTTTDQPPPAKRVTRKRRATGAAAG